MSELQQAACMPKERKARKRKAGLIPAGVIAEYLTPEQLAATLGKSTRTLARWDRLRIGPPRTSVGKMVLYPIAGVQRWLAANTKIRCRAQTQTAGSGRR